MRRFQVTVIEPKGGLEETITEAHSFTYDPPTGNVTLWSSQMDMIGMFRNVLQIVSLDDEAGREVARLELALSVETDVRRSAEEARDLLAREVRGCKDRIKSLEYQLRGYQK